MHKIQIVLFISIAALALVFAAPQSGGNRKYTDKYDHIDVDSILKNDRILTSYVKCMLDLGPCTAEGRQLKTDLPDALETDCAKCSPSQKMIVRKASRHLSVHRPADWKKLTDKYDPQATYKQQFEKFLKSDS